MTIENKAAPYSRNSASAKTVGARPSTTKNTVMIR
jgi:hypothetical protein